MRITTHPNLRRLCGAALLLGAVVPCAAAEKTSEGKSDEAAIRAAADAFVKAFDQGDATAIAALWTEDGSLADERGRLFKGRKAIEDEYAAFFKEHPGLRMEIAVQSIEFATPTVAIEDGLARAMDKEETSPAVTRYTAIHVQKDGKWLMASVRELSAEIPSNYAHLQALEWLVGSWRSKSDGAVVHATYRWIANRSFLQREYTVKQDGVTTSSGMQIIGWDPRARRIASWSFDSRGGHGTGAWTPTPQGWRIESKGTLADGTPTSSQELLIRVGDENDVLGWRSLNRKLGAADLPDTPEVVLERLSEKR